MQQQRAEACAIHWGPAREAHIRHPALLASSRVIPTGCWCGPSRANRASLLHPELASEHVDGIDELLRSTSVRWATRQEGAGTSRFLDEHLRRLGIDAARSMHPGYRPLRARGRRRGGHGPGPGGARRPRGGARVRAATSCPSAGSTSTSSWSGAPTSVTSSSSSWSGSNNRRRAPSQTCSAVTTWRKPVACCGVTNSASCDIGRLGFCTTAGPNEILLNADPRRQPLRAYKVNFEAEPSLVRTKDS